MHCLFPQVGDVNDNPPSWDQTRYAVNVSETVVVNTVVLYMFAYDADSGANGHVTYRFAPQQPDSVLGLFNLNTTTGEVSSNLKMNSGIHFYVLK